MAIDGHMLVAWGFQPGAYFKQALATANQVLAAGGSIHEARAAAEALRPAPPQPLAVRGERPVRVFIEAETAAERTNVDAAVSAIERWCARRRWLLVP